MAELKRFNLRNPEFETDPEDPDGFRAGVLRIGPKIGARKMGASIYELPPGQAVCPYHYEYPDEEWAVALTPGVSLRHPGGVDVLEEGDAVCFPAGPEGAHKLFNAGEETVRVLLLSTKAEAAFCVYPDSDKIGLFTDTEEPNTQYRRAEAADYYEGETHDSQNP